MDKTLDKTGNHFHTFVDGPEFLRLPAKQESKTEQTEMKFLSCVVGTFYLIRKMQ